MSLLEIIFFILFSLIKVVCLLICIAYYTAAERKVMAAIHRRRGPNVVGFWGLLQPIADGIKLILKEMIVTAKVNSVLFVAAPLSIFIFAITSWAVIVAP